MAQIEMLQMDSSLAQKYRNTSQKTRVITEAWVENVGLTKDSIEWVEF